jgi:hypothetical protein
MSHHVLHAQVNRYPVVVQTYSPGVKVLRQVSSPNLSPPTATAMVVPAAQSPGWAIFRDFQWLMWFIHIYPVINHCHIP